MNIKPYWSDKDVFSSGQRALAKQLANKKLLTYLEGYQNGLLTNGGPEGLPSFAKQHDTIVAVMRNKYAVEGYHQTISKIIVEESKFLELMLSMEFVSHEIKLVSIGYLESEVVPGISRTVEVPYAEFIIVGEKLKRAVVSSPVNTIPDPLTNNFDFKPESDDELQIVTISMTINGVIYAELANNEKRLIKKTTRDRAPYNFMNYMLGHQKQDIPIGDVQTKVDGCTAKKDMTELAKDCGFTKDLHPLKPLYFGGTTKKKVHFKATASLNLSQVELLMNCTKISA